MALKDWKYKKVDKYRDLWTKGDMWIHLDKHILNDKFDKDKYEVGCSERINKKTLNGHFIFYKSKNSAIKFVRRYMRKN